MAGYTSILRREPLGVVASIAPWNYPLMMAIWKIGPALAAGNAVVLKPSELTPLTALRLAELSEDLLPPGVLNVVTGQGESAGAALAGHPEVAIVSITGEVGTGKAVMRAAADSLKRVHLELGGKAPVVIFDDADLEAAIAAVRLFGYFNAGQDCTASTRVIAGPRVYGDFVDGLAEAASSLVMGSPTDEATELGPLVSADQRERVAGFVDRAVGAGARVVTGGGAGDGPGFYYRPSVVVDVAQDSEIAQREVFGPVVTVQRFSRRGRGDRLGQRRRLRAVRLGVDPRRRPCPPRRERPAVRHRLGQRPRAARVGDAARRLQAVRHGKGHVRARARALHGAQARDDQHLLSPGARRPVSPECHSSMWRRCRSEYEPSA